MDDMLKSVNGLSGEDKYKKFERLLPSLGDKFVKDGLCKSYYIRFFGSSDIPCIYLNNKPMKYSELTTELNDKVDTQYEELLYSCGITEEEYEESLGAVMWELVRG